MTGTNTSYLYCPPLPTNKMTKENLRNDIANATEKLLDMARDHSWNTISNNCLYIISEIKYSNEKNLFEQRKTRKKVNRNKKPQPLQLVASELESIYEKLYDVNLYAFQSTSKQTVVEVQYCLKSSLDTDYLEKVKDNEPMLHCKVAIPPYLNDNKSKFDINWELGGLRHEWNTYWWRIRTKRELRKTL